jgi:hypothetical protein
LSPFSYEVELLGLALALYLYDCSVLLYANEAVLDGGTPRWQVHFGWTRFLLHGRSLCVLNPFTPQRAAFRLGWQFEQMGRAGDAAWSDLPGALQPLRMTTVVAALALFVVLPVGMFSALKLWIIIPALLLLYGSALLGALRVRPLRRALGLEGWRYAGFLFECLACPPFAANMLRRVALSQRIGETLPLAAVRLLSGPDWLALRARLAARLDDEMEVLEEQSPLRGRLSASKQALEALVRP